MNWDSLFSSVSSRVQISEIREILKLVGRPGVISLAGGIPDSNLFPIDEVRASYDSVLSDVDRRKQALQYSESEGFLPLRDWIRDRLAQQGLEVSSDNVLVVNGSQQALDLLGKLFLSSGDLVLAANPTYLGALQAFGQYGAEFRACEPEFADNVPHVGNTLQGCKLAYMMADFANPSGHCMTATQRSNLVCVAHEQGVPVIEDAAYCDLWFDEPPPPSLAATSATYLNEREQDFESSSIIYVGTFSKTLVPGLRVGWIVAPKAIISKLVILKQASDLHTSTLNQMVLLDLAERVLNSHAGTLREAYRDKRNGMLSALDEFFPAEFKWSSPKGGMFVWVEAPPGWDTRQLLFKAVEDAQVAYVPGEAFFVDPGITNFLRLSFSAVRHQDIALAIRRLANLLENQVCK